MLYVFFIFVSLEGFIILWRRYNIIVFNKQIKDKKSSFKFDIENLGSFERNLLIKYKRKEATIIKLKRSILGLTLLGLLALFVCEIYIYSLVQKFSGFYFEVFFIYIWILFIVYTLVSLQQYTRIIYRIRHLQIVDHFKKAMLNRLIILIILSIFEIIIGNITLFLGVRYIINQF